MRAKSAANDNIIIDSEFAALIPPLLEEEHIQLLVNIVGDGCHEPLSIWDNDSKHVLIDGHNRHDICTKNHIPFTTTLLKFEDRDHVKVWIGERQLGRRNLTDDQRAVVANDMRETLSALARSEQAKAARAGDVSAKSTDTSKKDTRAAVAVESKLPERKLRLAQEIKKASSDVYNMVRAGTVKLTEGKKLSNLPEATRKTAIAAVVKGGDVRNAVRGAKKQDYNDRIAITKPKILEGTYRIIYVDPPWKYVGLNGNDDHGHAEAHYDCLDDEQLKAYKPGNGTRLVKDVADKNAVLFMWVTAPLLRRCFPIIEAWGFEYKTHFVWDKIKHNMGHYSSVRHEDLLVCTKGACKPDNAKQSIERAKHSQKPREFYEIIETLYDHGRKLELFSRNRREGWEMDGNEQEDKTARAIAA